MSSLQGPTYWGGTTSLTQQNGYYNELLYPSEYVWNDCGRKGIDPWRDALLWPSSKLSGSDVNGCVLGIDSTSTCRWGVERAFNDSGCAQMKKLIGTTRDSSGNVLSSCMVQGFRTVDDVFIGQLTSDPSGYFEFCTPYTGTHYLVAYKGGSPDVAGTTLDTLVPT